MKKLNLLVIVILAITTLSLVSFSSTISTGKNQKLNKMTVLKGAEKAGYSESNEHSF